MLESAIAKGDRDEWVWDSLGTALVSLGRYRDAAAKSARPPAGANP
jgi:hypothetical protein